MTQTPCIICATPTLPGYAGRCLACAHWRYRHGHDRSAPRPAKPAPPDCATDGCIRPEYLDGLCKKHADESFYRQESAKLHQPTRRKTQTRKDRP